MCNIVEILKLVPYYKYYGGDENTDGYFYFTKNIKKYDIIPDFQNYCICGVPIKYNYYIKNKITGEIKVVGSKCIELFYYKCETCLNIHKFGSKCPIICYKENVIKEFKYKTKMKKYRSQIKKKLEKKLIPILKKKIKLILFETY